MVKIVDPTDSLVEDLAATMRPEDEREVLLSHNHTPKEALQYALRHSKWARMGVEGGRAIAMFGVGANGILCTTGCPWMLGSTRLALHRQDLARMSRHVVGLMRRGFSVLENYVHADNLVSVRWLRSCGFHIEPAAPYGVHRAPFHRFWMEGVL